MQPAIRRGIQEGEPVTSPYVREALDRVAEVRSAYRDLMYARYSHAETELNGRLLNRQGMRAGVDPLQLFSGTRAYAYAYASEELVEYWQSHPRLTFAEYERQSHERHPFPFGDTLAAVDQLLGDLVDSWDDWTAREVEDLLHDIRARLVGFTGDN